MSLSKYMSLHDACQIVNERTSSTGRGPIWQELKEGAVPAELWRGEKIGWDPVPADWWNDPKINWPVSPLSLFPNLPTASMFRVERRIIDELWPTSELPTSSGGRKRHGRPPDTSMAKADAPHLKSMSKLVEEGLTPTAAAREVVRQDGSGVPGAADPESKVRRLVGRFKN
jgi:hypothetical protein